jgi:saccharopine dehydrogenase-like NADP-dependent oxidoreductase
MIRRVLVIGGTGNFGTRLVENLVATTDFDVIIAARGIKRAATLAAALRARYPERQIDTYERDTATITARELQRLRVWCVADAAGPFATATSRLVEAAIAARCHYVDIADARDFVADIAHFDAAARAADVLVASGASTTPALSHAVLDQLVVGWRRINRVDIAISPGNRQPRGLSVVKAILASAGRPIRVFRNGAWSTARGMSLLVHRHMPGLGRRWLFLVETPDLDLIPKRFAPSSDATVRAGLELGILHLGVWALSKLVTIGILSSLVPLARPLRVIAEWFQPFGSGRGGMTVDVEGVDAAGQAVTATWALIADKDGPNVPILPALALIRALAAGRMTRRGALPCVGLLSLADIQRELDRFAIVIRTNVSEHALLRRVLGPSFDVMPQPVQDAHEVADCLLLTGRASVEGAQSLAGQIAARLFGFPAAIADVPVSVEMRADRDGEIWTRSFGDARFRSRLTPLRGQSDRARERFGLVTFEMELTAGPQGLDYAITSGRLGFIPLPSFLVPRSFAKERVDTAGRFTFDVPIALPGIGLLVHYRGWLEPVSPNANAIDPQA